MTVLGFPCNQFGAQEPGTHEEILEFAKRKYDANFQIFAKVEVNGDGACGAVPALEGAAAAAGRRGGHRLELHQVPGGWRGQSANALRAGHDAGGDRRRSRDAVVTGTPAASRQR